MSTIALVLDLDNTLYCWMDAYAPALDDQISYIAKKTGLTKKSIRESFRKVFFMHNSVEVVNAANELDIWDKIYLSYSEIEIIKEQSTKIFFETFSSKLNLFPNVLQTLMWAKEKNFLIFAFSDGRAFWIGFRLEQLGISSFFEKIYVMEDEPNTSKCCEQSSKMVLLPESRLKPNTYILDSIMKEYNIEKDDLYVVGDSKNKDIKVAKLAGVKSIWAQYGGSYSAKSKRLLSSITPWTKSQKSGGHLILPQYSIADFSEIKNIIKFEDGSVC